MYARSIFFVNPARDGSHYHSNRRPAVNARANVGYSNFCLGSILLRKKLEYPNRNEGERVKTYILAKYETST
jgi:hypothetical protein